MLCADAIAVKADLARGILEDEGSQLARYEAVVLQLIYDNADHQRCAKITKIMCNVPDNQKDEGMDRGLQWHRSTHSWDDGDFCQYRAVRSHPEGHSLIKMAFIVRSQITTLANASIVRVLTEAIVTTIHDCPDYCAWFLV